MGLNDRDYMRNQNPRDEDLFETVSGKVAGNWKLIAAIVIVLVGFFLFLNVRRHFLTPTSSRPVDINSASKDQIIHIPHINEAVADAIIQARPYSSVDDVLRAYGVGQKRLEWLRPYIFVTTNELVQ
jgi:hypothetical protein